MKHIRSLLVGALFGGAGGGLLVAYLNGGDVADFRAVERAGNESETPDSKGAAIRTQAALATSASSAEQFFSEEAYERFVELESIRVEAAENPYRAIHEALAERDDGKRRSSLRAVAAEWAKSNPRAALAQADILPAELQDEYREVVASEWAFSDPVDFLGWVERSEDIELAIPGLRVLTATDPFRVLDIAIDAARPRSAAMKALIADAIHAAVDDDADSIIPLLEDSIRGPETEFMLRAAALGLARNDPKRAFAWASSIKGRHNLRETVVGAVAELDLMDALRLVPLGDEELIRRMATAGNLATRALGAGQDARGLADELVVVGSTTARMMLEELVSAWSREMPMDALDWMVANQASVTTSMNVRTARSLASSNVAMAIELTNRIPIGIRPIWVAEVAVAQAKTDLDRALVIAAELRGGNDYDVVRSNLISAAAEADPAAAARALGNETTDASAAGSIARAWATREPLAALDWAMTLANDDLAVSTSAFIAGLWSRSQKAEAEQWAATLPEGRLRDQVEERLRRESTRDK